MKHLLIIFSILAFITPAIGNETVVLECSHDGTRKYAETGRTRDYKPKIERIAIQLRNGIPVSMTLFSEEECSFNNSILACKNILKGDGMNFGQTRIINQNTGEFFITLTSIRNGSWVLKDVGAGYCKKLQQKKLF